MFQQQQKNIFVYRMHLNIDDTVMCFLFCYHQQDNACSSKTPQWVQTVIVSLCTVTVVKQIIGMCMKHLIMFVCNLELFHLVYGILTKTKALLNKSNVNTCLCFCISKIKPFVNRSSLLPFRWISNRFSQGFCFLCCLLRTRKQNCFSMEDTS